MLGYEEVDKKLIEVLRQYKKSSERCKVSGLIEVNNKFYREVIFTKRNFLKIEAKGYIYLDDENKAVSNRTILSELAKLGYYYEILFSDDKSGGILATMKTEQDIQREKNNIEQISEALDFLLTQKVYEAERVKSVFIKNHNLREKGNRILQELSDIILNISQKEFNFELLNKLYPYYEDMLKVNFEKVLCIASIEDCIDVVIKQAEIKRKKWGVRILSNMVGKLIKLSDELSYFKRLIVLYSSVLEMNSNQYLKYLSNINKEKIENRIELIRI